MDGAPRMSRASGHQKASYKADEATEWVLDRKYGRYATVPSYWSVVVELADTVVFPRFRGGVWA